MLEKYWLELIFGLISAGAIAFCKYLHTQLKDYKNLLEKREDEHIEKTIDEKLKPIQDQIRELEFYIAEVANKEKADMSKIVASWGFRITQLCELYLEQGYFTHSQYIQLVEMYNLYSALGGNGKVKEYFEKTAQLQMKTEK